MSIDKAIQFANKFANVIIDKTQLQRFLGSLNYIAEFYKYLSKQCKPLFDQLQNNPPPWSNSHTSFVKQIKSRVKTLPCLGIPTINDFKIVEIDASDIGFRGSLPVEDRNESNSVLHTEEMKGILKQLVSPDSSKQIVRFHSGI